MSYTIGWADDSHTMVRQVYEGHVGKRAFEAMVHESVRLLETVTHNVRTVVDVPLRLKGKNIPPLVEVRGEIYMSKAHFAALNERQEAVDEALRLDRALARLDQEHARPRRRRAGVRRRRRHHRLLADRRP